MTKTSEYAEQKKVLGAVIAEKQKAMTEIVDSIKGEGTEGSPLTMEAGMQETFQAHLAEKKEAQVALDAILAVEEGKQYQADLEAPERIAASVKSTMADFFNVSEAEASKTVGAAFLESDVFKEMMEAGEFKTRKPFSVKGDLGSLGRKDIYSDLPGGTPGRFGSVQRDAMVLRPQRTSRVRDLFPVQNTTAAVIEYFRVTGFTNNASPVPERNAGNTGFGAKPQSNLEFTGEQASVRTIAHWEAAHRNALRDEPQLRGLIENELLYGLRLVEDDQILNGTGTGQDLLGIRNVPGIQEYAWSEGSAGPPADNKADAIRRAMTLALLAYYEPTGVVLHDGDWEDIELLKDDNGQYLMAVSIAVGGEQRVWRAPVVTTPAMDEGFGLVGAFGIGAQLYDREEGSIRIAEQHSTFFVENAIVVLAEESLALATKRPEAFVEIEFDAAPA
jgi:HK97 family phage major capsid protein